MDSSPLQLPFELGEDVRVIVPTQTWAFLSALREEIDAALEELEDADE